MGVIIREKESNPRINVSSHIALTVHTYALCSTMYVHTRMYMLHDCMCACESTCNMCNSVSTCMRMEHVHDYTCTYVHKYKYENGTCT